MKAKTHLELDFYFLEHYPVSSGINRKYHSFIENIHSITSKRLSRLFKKWRVTYNTILKEKT